MSFDWLKIFFNQTHVIKTNPVVMNFLQNKSKYGDIYELITQL